MANVVGSLRSRSVGFCQVPMVSESPPSRGIVSPSSRAVCPRSSHGEAGAVRLAGIAGSAGAVSRRPVPGMSTAESMSAISGRPFVSPEMGHYGGALLDSDHGPDPQRIGRHIAAEMRQVGVWNYH